MYNHDRLPNGISRLTGSDAGYLKGNILDGSDDEIAQALYYRGYPAMPELIRSEVARLRTAYQKQTGLNIDPIQSLAELTGTDAASLGEFMCKNTCARNVAYLSDPFITRDLFPLHKAVSNETLLRYCMPDGKTIAFFPLTTWHKAGNAVMRFGLADVTLQEDGFAHGSVRFPVIMIDNQMLETIREHDSSLTILDQLRDLAKLTVHDYLHTSVLYFGKNASPPSLAEWNNKMWEGTEIWQKSPVYKQNYEVLSCIGHRQIMQRLMSQEPAFKKHVLQMARKFFDDTKHLVDEIGVYDQKLAGRMENYLTTNYARFLFHIIHPRDPDFAWITQQYPNISRDLNIDTHKGLVSTLHDYEGIPGSAKYRKPESGAPASQEGVIPFAEWFTEYREGIEEALEKCELPARRTLKPTRSSGKPNEGVKF